MRQVLFFIILIPALAGCASSYVEQKINPLTREIEKVKYSDFFEGEGLIFNGQVKVIGLATVKKVKKVGEEKQGKLKVVDLVSNVKFRIHFFDKTPSKFDFELISIFYNDGLYKNFLFNSFQRVSVVPYSSHLVDTELFVIDGTSKEISLAVVGRKNGRRETVKFTMRRLTVEEARAKGKYLLFKF